MLTINGVDLNFNLYDYETAANYESALAMIQNNSAAKGSLAETIKAQCELVFEFFDTVFGAGTAEQVFAGKYDFKVCTEALGDVINNAKAQTQDYHNLVNRYAPNRAARRAAK